MSTEVSLDERIEAARAKLLTAYNQMIESGGKKEYEAKWKVRKAELELLLTPKPVEQ